MKRTSVIFVSSAKRLRVEIVSSIACFNISGVKFLALGSGSWGDRCEQAFRVWNEIATYLGQEQSKCPFRIYQRNKIRVCIFTRTRSPHQCSPAQHWIPHLTVPLAISSWSKGSPQYRHCAWTITALFSKTTHDSMPSSLCRPWVFRVRMDGSCPEITIQLLLLGHDHW